MPISRRTLFHAAAGILSTTDNTNLHYTIAGSARNTIVFVPGWAMPGWIWQNQLDYFAPSYRVVALDPRGQGESDVPSTGYDQDRRGQDIAELLARLGGSPVLLVGWSLGVLDILAYLHRHGDASIAGLVLVDNSVGENPPPPPPRPPPPRPPHRAPPPYPQRMAAFVRGMFRRPQDPAFLARLTAAALHLPEADGEKLLAYPVPRTFWREAIYATNKPVLYAVRPGLAGQAANLQARHPATVSVIFADAGHALFIDDAMRFNTTMKDFIQNLVWP